MSQHECDLILISSKYVIGLFEHGVIWFSCQILRWHSGVA